MQSECPLGSKAVTQGAEPDEGPSVRFRPEADIGQRLVFASAVSLLEQEARTGRNHDDLHCLVGTEHRKIPHGRLAVLENPATKIGERLNLFGLPHDRNDLLVGHARTKSLTALSIGISRFIAPAAAERNGERCSRDENSEVTHASKLLGQPEQRQPMSALGRKQSLTASRTGSADPRANDANSASRTPPHASREKGTLPTVAV